MNEIEAAQALGEISRARKAAGLPWLDELQAAWFLADLAELRRLPETAERVPVPAPRRPDRRRAGIWLKNQ